MAILSAAGSAQGLDGRQAGAQAARAALDQLGGIPIQFALILASSQHRMQAVLNGVASLLGNTPLFGFSTSGFITTANKSGQKIHSQRQVKVLLLAGQDLQARADWFPAFGEASQAVLRKSISELDPGLNMNDLLMVAADGIRGNAARLCEAIGAGRYPIVGVLASGDALLDETSQLGGASAGSGGLAAAWLSGAFEVGLGAAHGWTAAGPNLVVTHVRDQTIRTLDDLPAAEAYAGILGSTVQNWTQPPLSKLARVYPLGIETSADRELDLMLPVRFEADGSLRFNSLPSEGCLAYLMTGSAQACLAAAATAAEQAVANLKSERPLAALVFADQACAYLMEGQLDQLADPVRSLLGERVPVIGGCTLGHLQRPYDGTVPNFRQGEVLVAVLAERG